MDNSQKFNPISFKLDAKPEKKSDLMNIISRNKNILKAKEMMKSKLKKKIPVKSDISSDEEFKKEMLENILNFADTNEK